MTAEIAIMNKEAIALAADSAVTFTGASQQKIFSSANKLFALSKYYPVGIMVYGNALFMEMPWETIIKHYRKLLGQKKLKTLKGYSDNFIRFLDNGNNLFPIKMQEHFFASQLYGFLNYINDSIKKAFNEYLYKHDKIKESDAKILVSNIIDQHYEQWNNAEIIKSLSKTFETQLGIKYKAIIESAISNIFEKAAIKKSDVNKLKRMAAFFLTRRPKEVDRSFMSGVVIAGFGENEMFPSLRAFYIEGIINNRLIYTVDIESQISFEQTASIIPFAQREMVQTFMEGIDPNYFITENRYLYKLIHKYTETIVDNINGLRKNQKESLKNKLGKISDKMIADFQQQLTVYREEEFSSPITKVVAMLPKDELASMAETLISLTSFKRKVTMEIESVGGPIDVAVISKGDGLVWIKRKHYFTKDLNYQFFSNYYGRISYAQRDKRKRILLHD